MKIDVPLHVLRFAAMFPVSASPYSSYSSLAKTMVAFQQDKVGRVILDGVVDAEDYYKGNVLCANYRQDFSFIFRRSLDGHATGHGCGLTILGAGVRKSGT